MGLDMYLNDRNHRTLGYWRKANAIHGWFIRTLANDVDDCKPVKVTREQLAELRKLCLIVNADKKLAPVLLPPTQGFFFGSYDIDDCYFDDIRETVNIIDNALNSKKRVFYYQSSW